MAEKILVVDDEKNIVRVLRAYLEKEGYLVSVAYDGAEALRLARAGQPDLIILDLMLPQMSGEDVCRRLRAEGSRVPVVMLTAKADLEEKLHGLAVGADDYVVKPFSPREVVARVKTVLRRASAAAGPLTDILSLVSGSLQIDIPAHSAAWQGEALDLTPTEFRLLAYLAGRPGRVFSRGQLSDAAFGYSGDSFERTIDAHIKNIRRKLSRPGAPPLIKTVYGVGYKFDSD